MLPSIAMRAASLKTQGFDSPISVDVPYGHTGDGLLYYGFDSAYVVTGPIIPAKKRLPSGVRIDVALAPEGTDRDAHSVAF